MVLGNRSVVSLCRVSAISIYKGEVFSENNQEQEFLLYNIGIG